MKSRYRDKVLFLGNIGNPLIDWLRDHGEDVRQCSDKLMVRNIRDEYYTWLISYGYRYILGKDVFDLFPDRAINLHISYLPWNGGCDPNFWSFVEDTPKGVTIHYLDEGMDTGDIIVQERVDFDYKTDTLRTSYDKLCSAIEDLFKRNWGSIKWGICERRKQEGDGSCHSKSDMVDFRHLLRDGWDTPVWMLDYCPGDDVMVSRDFWDNYYSGVKELQVGT